MNEIYCNAIKVSILAFGDWGVQAFFCWFLFPLTGVNLWKLEQRPNVGSMLLKLDFHTDVAPRLVFLKDIGVEDSRLGHIVSHNPFILTESLENLRAR